MKGLDWADVAGIAISWVGAAAVAFFTKNAIVSIFCFLIAYYIAEKIVSKGE